MARYDQGLASSNPDLRSQAYRARGLSADTSIRPCYALDATWSALDLGTPERLAVIGPGGRGGHGDEKGRGENEDPEISIHPSLEGRPARPWGRLLDLDRTERSKGCHGFGG